MEILISLRNSRYMQYLAALLATLSVASFSTYNTWPSPTLLNLTSENSSIGVTLTDKEASWVASITTLTAAVPGSIVSGVFVERLGRRGSLLFAGIPLFFPWIAITFAKSFLTLMIARAVAGVGVAITLTVASMYIGEIAEKDIRGKLGTAYTFLKLTGSLYVLSVGPFVSYKALALSCGVIPLVFMATFYFMPETPYFLIKTGKNDEARINLIKLSSNTTDVKTINERLNEIEETVQRDMKNKCSIWQFFSKQEYRKPLIIMLGMVTIQQFSGKNAIEIYIQPIIKLSGSNISPEVSSIICGVIQLPAALLSAVLVDKVGRKPLMIVSALGCALALIGEGVYFYLQDELKINVDHLSWLPLTGLVLFLIMLPIGVYSLPNILLGELFATNAKGIAISLFTFYSSLAVFLVVKFFQPISDAWGMHTMFWMYAGILLLGSVFVLIALPETKGKSFAEIQEILNRNRKVVT